MGALSPAEEALRLARLRELAVLDTEAEPLFDALARTAAMIAGVPIALITLIDADRQWFKANIGLAGTSETPRDMAFCAHTILGGELFEIGDARLDSRFSSNRLVTGKPGICFYAGAPITLSDGTRVGSLCVIDTTPRTLDDDQRQMLRSLADAAAHALELRSQTHRRHLDWARRTEQSQSQLRDMAQRKQQWKAREAFLERTGRLADVGGWELEVATGQLSWSDGTCRLHEVPPGYQPTLAEALSYYPAGSRERVSEAVERAIRDGTEWDLDVTLVTATGREIWVRVVGLVERDAAGQPCILAGAIQDITLRKRAVLALERSERRFRKLFQYSLGPICTHDHEGVLLSVNQAAADSLGYSVGELLGRPLTDLLLPGRNAAFAAYLLRMMRNDRDSGALQLRAKDGTLRTWQYHNVLDDDEDEPYVLVHAQDITERYRQEQELLKLSTRDPLTGCFNRRFLAELEARADDTSWGCVVIDLDHFKQVNDSHGHARGDQVLVEMAHFLNRHTRPQDAVVRLGGDEFLLLLHEADAGVTGKIVERIGGDRAHAPIGFTMGAAVFGDGVPLDGALAEADQQLYRERRRRRDDDAE